MKKMAKLKQARKTSKNSLKLFTSIPPIYYSIFCYKKHLKVCPLCDLDPPFCKVNNFTGFVVQRIIPLQKKTMNRKNTYYDVLLVG